MYYEEIETCIHQIQTKLKYPYVEYINQKDKRLYFSAIDDKQTRHDIWYNLTSEKYFETINGSAILIKDLLF